MTARRRRWLEGITPGGLIVTSTVACIALTFALTACWLFITGATNDAKDAGTAAAAAMATLVALQARNRPDPAAVIDQPATVTATSDVE